MTGIEIAGCAIAYLIIACVLAFVVSRWADGSDYYLLVSFAWPIFLPMSLIIGAVMYSYSLGDTFWSKHGKLE